MIGGTFGGKCFAGVEIGEAEKSNMKRYGLTMEDVLSSQAEKTTNATWSYISSREHPGEQFGADWYSGRNCG